MNIKHSSIILATIFLLLLPLILFFTFWLKFSILYLVFVIYLLKDLLPHIKNTFTETLHLPPLKTLIAAVIVLSWILYGGIGKVGYQNFDYVKHNSIFYDLLHSPWPVETTFENKQHYLVYYLGYYLVPAGLGKIFDSLFILEIASIIQAFFAVSILLLMLMIISRSKNAILLIIALIFWGGLDIFGNLLFQQDYSKKFGEFVEWWAGASNFQYTGFTDLLYWVPQHAIGGWLTTTLCFAFLQRGQYRALPFIVSLSLLWSPFVCIGLLPFLLVALNSQATLKSKVEWCFSRYGNFAIMIVLLLMSYYATSSMEQPFKWQYTKMGPSEFFPRYLTFLLLEISLPALFIFTLRKYLTKDIKFFFYATLLFLIITPHIYLGIYSDFAMRGSIAGLFSLFIMTTLIYKEAHEHYKMNARGLMKLQMLAVFFLILTSYSAISDFYRAQNLKHIELGYGPTKNFDPDGISKQYLGDKGAAFFKFFF